jgi:hypothetical protein
VKKLGVHWAPFQKKEDAMSKKMIVGLAMGVALMGMSLSGEAGEIKAKVEAAKGEMKATAEEMKGEAKAKIEEAKGNKASAAMERAKGNVKGAYERVKGKVKEVGAKAE